MNLDRPNLNDSLAGRYVLGVMRAGARRRFEAQLRYHPSLRARVVEWEERLGALHESGKPVAPPAHLRGRILSRVEGEKPARSPLLAWWATLATAFSLVLVSVLVIGPGVRSVPDAVPVAEITEPGPMQVAVLADSEARGQFLVCTDSTTRRSVVEVIGNPELPTDKDGELWLVAGDEPPRSLGLMPATGRGYFEVPGELVAGLDGGTLAVSIEPKGGSPSGAPTGAIPYSGRVIGMWTGNEEHSSSFREATRARVLAGLLRPGR